jgi:hypothetical protein
MSIQESFECFTRHETTAKLDELHRMIEAAWKLARELRDNADVSMDSSGRLADVTAHLNVAREEVRVVCAAEGRAPSVEQGCGRFADGSEAA